MNYIRHKVKNFIQKSNLQGNITLSELIKAANRMSVIVKPYSSSKRMLLMLRLSKESNNVPALCVKDQDNIMIFYDDTLSEDESAFAIAHEIDHIELGHNITGKNNEKQEKEANTFAHYLLTPANNYNMAIKACVISLCICFSIIIILITPWQESDQLTSLSSKDFTRTAKSSESVESQSTSPEINNNDICYFTEKGEVYHLYRDCGYLKNSKTVMSDTIAHCHKDRLCSACERRYESELNK